MIKAIETKYKGYRFRSRLEARWAVFFDTLGIKWEYEPEGFELPGGARYLPDFKVTAPSGTVTWYEIKPPGHGPCEKMLKLEKAYDDQQWGEMNNGGCSDYACVQFQTLCGDPADVLLGPNPMDICPRCASIQARPFVAIDKYGLSANCYPCDWHTPSGDGNPSEPGILASVFPRKGILCVEDYIQIQLYFGRIHNAATAARSARFEHGETPQINKAA